MEIVVGIIAQYLVLGFVFAMFIAVLAKRPTLKLVAFELFCWPHRVVKGIKAVYRNMGKLEAD